jgi:hypothetical protein
MGRMLTAVTATSASVANVEVPDDLRAELVELYRFLSENPGKRGSATFDTADELTEFVKQARSWAATNDVEFRKVRGSETDTSLMFYLRDPISEEDKERAAAAREAAKAKREAEGNGTPGRKPSGKAK